MFPKKRNVWKSYKYNIQTLSMPDAIYLDYVVTHYFEIYAYAQQFTINITDGKDYGIGRI